LKTKKALVLFGLMFVSFFVVTINSKSIAEGSYLWMGLTDGMLTFLNWSILKKVQEAEHLHEKLGYVIGGVLGAQLALFVSIHYLLHK
jgi:hypothetical protein